jgi:hypothetical protein
VSSQILVNKVLAVFTVSAFRQPKDREIISFAVYTLGCIALPDVDVQPFIPQIVEALTSIYSGKSKQKSWDKARRSHMETLTAISNLARVYPRLFTPALLSRAQSVKDLRESLVAPPLTIRSRALAAFGGIAYGLWSNWSDHSATGLEQRRNHLDELSMQLSALLLSGGQDRFNAMWKNATQKQEELPWLLNSVAVLPLLLGRRIKKTEFSPFHGVCVRYFSVSQTSVSLNVQN